jgi:multidrug efflux pump subunit AcrB/outer membrane protein TolC
MRSLIAWLVDHTTTVALAVGAVTLLGLIAYVTLPRESAPDITIPLVLITTTYPGVSPEDIEELISTPLEDELASLTDVERLSSRSAEGFSLVSVEFTPDVDIPSAVQSVRDRVGRARPKLPDDVEEPAVREINFSDIPVLLVTLAGPDETELVRHADALEERIARLDGVLDANVSGGVDRQIRVAVDPLRLAHYGLTLAQVNSAIADENVNIPGGNVPLSQGDFLLRVPGSFKSARDIEQVAIKRVGDRPVFVRDVAEVIDGQADRATYSRMGGQSSVTLSVTKRAGANIIAVADAIKAEVAVAAEGWPPTVRHRVLADQSEQIAQTVSELQNNIITALLLVVAVIVAFMGLRNSLFVAMAIPLSMLVTFLVLQTLGFTLNMVVLFALMLALGMLVDNAIVVVENVYRHVEAGMSPRDAAIEGTSEVAMAVAASTATTVAAFGPLVFWTGLMGEFMGFMPKTVIIVLVSSLVVAVGVLPVAMKSLMPAGRTRAQGEPRQPAQLGLLMRSYRRVLRFSIRWRWLSTGLGVATFLFTVGVYALFHHGTEFFAETEPVRAVVGVRLPDGADLDSTDRVTRAVEQLIAGEREVDTWVTEVGVSGAGDALLGAAAAPNEAKITVNFKPDRNTAKEGEAVRGGSTLEAVTRMRTAAQMLPGATITVEPEAMGPPVGKPIEVLVTGDDFHQLGEVAVELRREIAAIEGATDLSDDYRVGRPELRLRIDRGAANRVGVSTAQIGNMVRNAVAGTKVSALRIGEEEIDIVVELASQYRQDAQTVLDLRLPGSTDTSPDKYAVPLSSVASWSLRGGNGAIHHLDQTMVVTISGDVATGVNTNAVQSEVVALLGRFATPPGVELSLGGSNDEQVESQAFLGRAFLIAVLLIAMVLVTQFDSISTPLIILFTVLLSLIGVMWGLLLTGTPFGVIMTGLGVISLAGVVVNNAIVLLDYVEQLRARGLSTEDALIEAGLTRFRPVMLTAITTTLGLIPMAMGVGIDFANAKLLIGGASAQWWGPMAIAVIFGLSFATVLTLVMVPTLYSLFEQIGSWMPGARSKARSKAALAAAAGVGLLLAAPSADAVTLEQAWAAADTQAIGLAVSREQQIQTGTLRGKALSALSPQLDSRGTYVINQREVSFDMAESFPEEVLALIPDFESEPTVMQQKTFWQAEIGVSQRFFSGAALPGYRSAVLLHQAAALDVDNTRAAMKQQVAASFFALQTAHEAVAINEAALSSAEHRQTLAERQVQAGIASSRATTQAKLDVAVARRELESARRQRIDAEEQFASLTGLRGVELEPAEPRPAPTDVDQALGQAKSRRADLQAAEVRTKATRWETLARDLRYLPVVDGRFAYLYDENTGFSTEPWNWRATVSASWQLWDGGLRAAERREAASRMRVAQLNTRQLGRDAEREVRVAFEALRIAETAMAASGEETTLAGQNLELAERSFAAGAATWLDVEQAELQQRVASLAQLQARQQRELAAIRLAGATGDL